MCKNCDKAWKVYSEAAVSAWETYEEAIASAWKAYDEVCKKCKD